MVEEMKKCLAEFLKKKEILLICCAPEGEYGKLLADAVTAQGGMPVFWEDSTWHSLLRQAFVGHHSAIAGPPQLLLGLGKLSRQRGTPLYIRNAILTETCPNWVRESIEKSLDCQTWVIPAGEVPEDLPPDLLSLKRHLLHWSSVLDCRLVRGSYGLEMQVTVFPGKKLPEFPTCAKLDIQPWTAERDAPFYLTYDAKHWKNH